MRNLARLAFALASTIGIPGSASDFVGFKRGPTPNRYTPHIGAKQRGKYPPNMPLHITGWQRRAELQAWNDEMDAKHGKAWAR